MAGRAVVGLDIGTAGVRAAELSSGKGGYTLQRFGQIALPVGAVRDGEVVQPEVVAAALKQLWSSAKFGTKNVVLGVANQKVVVRQVDLPWMPLPELRKSLAFQAQDYVPMPIEQAILDIHPLEEHVNESGGRMLRVLLVAAARDMVMSAIDAVSAAGLTPTMIDLTPFAILRALHGGSAVFSSPAAEAIVDVGSNVTNIIVHQDGVPRFVRILLMGGADITEAVAERMGIPTDQAEALKQASGMSPEPLGLEEHPVTRAIEQVGGSLVEEVRGSLDYYLAQSGSGRLNRLVLSGGGSQLAGLGERLSAATRLPVELARPMSNLTIGKTGLTEEQLDYVEPMVSVPVGLALGVAS